MKTNTMIAVAAIGFAGLLGTLSAAPHALAAGKTASVQGLDTDNDGTIDLNEAKTAAVAEFDKLDADHEGTLDKKELGRRVSKKDWPKADPDKEGTVDKKEYTALVEQRFKAADADNDGTVSAQELSTPAGKSLHKLLK